MKEVTSGPVAEASRKLDLLKNIDPYLIDVSLRESAIGRGIGETLSEKLNSLEAMKAFGFKFITLGALNYRMPEELQVDDDLMIHLRDTNYDVADCFALTSPGKIGDEGKYIPSPSELKLRDYKVPNCIHEVEFAGGVKLPDLKASIEWLVTNVQTSGGARPRIIVNIVDGCESFAHNLEATLELLQFLAEQPIEGVSFEDAQGTFLPFQVGAFTAAARKFLPAPLKLLVHIHAGAGVENASVIEALLNGADGAWGSLHKEGPVIGHASLGELIANLVRVGNPHMSQYQLKYLSSESADALHMLGKNRYSLPLSYFRQSADRFMDLAPEVVGATHSHRVCPIVSDPVVIANRLGEVLKRPANSFEELHLLTMIRLMRRDLRSSKKIHYDQSENLVMLYERACQGETE